MEVFKIKTLLIKDNLSAASFDEEDRHLLLLQTGSCKVVLWVMPYKENVLPIVRCLPWDRENSDLVCAFNFYKFLPESQYLPKALSYDLSVILITCDLTIYLVPVDKILQPRNSYLNELSVTSRRIRNSSLPSDFHPSAITWFGDENRNVAFIGSKCGKIIFYYWEKEIICASMDTGICSPIYELNICRRPHNEAYLLVTNELRQQWEMKLVNGTDTSRENMLFFVAQAEPNANCLESSSRHANNRQTSARDRRTQSSLRIPQSISLVQNAFTKLKQRFSSDSSRERNGLKDTPENDGASSTNALSSNDVSDFLMQFDCSGDIFMRVNRIYNQDFLCGFFIPRSVLMFNNDGNFHSKTGSDVRNFKVEATSLVLQVLLTDEFIIVADVEPDGDRHRVSLFSTRYSCCENAMADETEEFSQESLVQRLYLDVGDCVSGLYQWKMLYPKLHYENEVYEYIQSVIAKTSGFASGCLIVTNKFVHVVEFGENPYEMACNYIESDEKISWLVKIFGLDKATIIDWAAYKCLLKNNVAGAAKIYHFLNGCSLRVIKLCATLGLGNELYHELKKLLLNGTNSMSAPKCRQMANLYLLTLLERLMEQFSNEDIISEMINFLKCNEHYDRLWAFIRLRKYQLYKPLRILLNYRGLFLNSAVMASELIVLYENDPLQLSPDLDSFWELLSDEDLVYNFFLEPECSMKHSIFVKENVGKLNSFILQRLWKLFNPATTILGPTLQYVTTIDNQSYHVCKMVGHWLTAFLVVHLRLHPPTYSPQCADLNANPSSFPIRNNYTVRSHMKNRNKCGDLRDDIVSIGYSHAGLVSDSGILFMWGTNRNGCLGLGSTENISYEPTKVFWFVRMRIHVTSIACGLAHSIAITNVGVFSWGSSKYGQLGVGDRFETASPCLIAGLSDCLVIGVSAGHYHSLAIDDQGRLWTWGWGVHGQLGHGSTDNLSYPKAVEAFKNDKVIRACGGSTHSVVLTADYRVWTFGSNHEQQLGVSDQMKSCIPIRLFAIVEPITSVAAGGTHCLALSESCRLYMWGHHRTTVVSKENDDFLEIDDYIPVLVDIRTINKKIKKISCGLHHSALVTENGEVYVWGSNVFGATVGNSASYLVSPKLARLPLILEHSGPAEMVCCGPDVIFVVQRNSGDVIAWGMNNRSLLCEKLENHEESHCGCRSQFTSRGQSEALLYKAIEPRRIPNLPKMGFSFDMTAYSNPNANESTENFEIANSDHFESFQSEFDKLSKSPEKILQYILEYFYPIYDIKFIKEKCEKGKHYQVLAQLYDLEKEYVKTLRYNLLAARDKDENSEYANIFQTFLRRASQCRKHDMRYYLQRGLLVWIKFELPLDLVEVFLREQFDKFGLLLAGIIFFDERNRNRLHNGHSVTTNDETSGDIIFSKLSPAFLNDLCRNIVSGLSGNESSFFTRYEDMIRWLSKAAFAPSVPFEHVTQEEIYKEAVARINSEEPANHFVRIPYSKVVSKVLHTFN